MNHIYKVIWNTITQTWVAVSELSRAKGKTKSSKTLTAVVLAAVSTGAVVGGAEAAMFAGQGDGISIQSQNRNTKVAKAEGVTAIAIGYDVSSKGTSALAIGTQTHATGEKTVAVGHLATATGSESAAFGVNATAAGNGDIALGKHAVAQGGANGVTGSAALGDEAHATGAQSAAVGGKSSASGTHTIASGYKAGASGENAAAFGADSTASGTNAASIGPSSTASGSNSAALGMQAQAKGAGSLAAGAAAQATKDGSTAVGTWTEATAEKTTALGDSAHATTNRATALGHDSQATGEFSTAAGVSSRASGSASVATGKNATASGANTIAIGNAANAAGTDSIATGRQAATTGSNAIATGADSSAANNASAYGNKAKATGGWSSAFGNESKAAAADASAFGNTATAAAQDSTAIGAHSSVTSVATGGTALGRSSSVTTAGGVALGQGSASTRAALDGKNITISSEGSVVSSNHITDDDSRNNNSNDVYAPVKLINDPNTLTRVKETIKGSAGAVSLGNGTTTRQLTNLAPGSADSDAVNVAQLKAVVGSIKKYTVTSPEGSITVTSPTSGQDPQNFQISMNTTAVKDAAAWKIKANKEADDKATSVRGGDIVTFKAKDGGNSGDTIKISRNGKELTFEANYATIRTPGTGTVNVDNGVKDNWLAKAKNVAEAINASGWTLQANGDNVGLVNPGDKVNIATDANSGITITPTNEDAHGVSTIKLKANVTGLTAGKNVTISSKDGNYTISATDTNTQASVSKKSGSPITVTKTTTTPNSPDYAVGLDIDDKTLEIKGGKLAAKTQAQAVESVEKKAGDDNIAEVDVKSGSTKGAANAVYTVAVTKSAVKDAAAWNIKEGSETTSTAVKGGDTLTLSDTNTIDVVHNGKDFTFNAKTATIQTEQKQAITKIDVSNEGITTKTTGGNNTPTGRFIVPTGNNADKHALATAYDVADKVNQTGWNLYTNGGAPILINPGDYVNFKSGKATNANIVTEASEGATISYDVNVDDTTIKIDPNGNKLTANTVDLTVNNGKVTKPSTDDGKKLVNATTVANAVNNSYWKATRGTSDETNADEGDATSNVKAGDELTFVAGKNMALKKAGNTFTYGTKNDVSFTTVTSNGVTVNNGGSLTVGAGSTINMGNNIVGGVANGVADTDAVNVAQLKANTSVVSAGDNITVTPSTNAEGNKVYTVAAKNTQATVSKAEGDNPITLDNSTTNANGTTNYKVGLNIDESTLEVKEGKLAAKAQTKAIETVESKEGGDNIAQVDVKSGKAKGDAGATYQVSVTKNDVKDVAKEAVDVRGSDFITVTPTDGEHLKTHTVAAKTGTIAVTETTGAVTSIATATGLVTDKTVADAIAKSGFQLKQGEETTAKTVINPGDSLTFKDGQGTKAVVNANGDVQVNANVASLTGGDNVTVKDNGNGSFTINAKDTNTQASVSKAANSPITINATGADNAKNYELDVAVDGTTIVKKDGKLTANVPDVSTTDLTVNNGKVTEPGADDGKKLVNATTVAKVVNNSYWKATRGTSDNTNDDKAEGDATSNIKAGDELTFVAGKNMALKKAGNTFTYGTKDNVSFTTVTSNGVTVNDRGSLTVGAGSTINMGNNIVGGVANGIADTDAVNVAQLKANTTTVVAGKNVSVDVAENASTGKTFTVNADKTTVSGTGPVSVKATSDAANHTTNYNVEFDSSKAAEQTDLTYKANGKDAKKVKLSEGLDFTNGKGTKASVGDNGKVTFDATVADVKQGDNVTINKDETTGVYTVNAKDTITTVKGKNGSAAKVTTATGSTDTNKIYEVDVNVDGKTIVNENGTLQAKGWKTKVVKGEGEVEGASEETVNGSDTVNYIAGKNVKLVQDGKNFTIATKDNVTFKDTTTTNLSVTPGGKVDMGNNKVTNVAEGTENTDAVNVKQLKDFKAEVADGGLTFAGNSGTAHKAKLNTTVNIKGGKDNTDATKFDNGKNVMTAVNGDTVTVSIKKTPEVEGINITDTTGNVKVKLTQTDEGLKVSDGNNNATRITNVKAGEKDTDAVNVKQLKAAKTEVEAGENIEITSRTDTTNGQTIYKVSAKGINDTSAAVKGGSDHVKVTKAANTHKDGSTTVTDYTVDLSNKTKEDIKKGVDAHTEVTTKGLTFNADKGTTGVKKLGSKVSVNGDGKNITTTADENGVKVSMKDDIKVNSVTTKEVKVGNVNINENGINAGGKRITNVAPGKDGTDAVNVNQLKYVAGNISNQINNVDKGLRAGIAGALASGGLYHATTSGKSMVSVGAGTYRGQNALAVGYSRLSDNGKVGVKFTVNSNSQGHAGASASVGYQW
ncbi:ESPR-type extended signal peptide-containing protein [Haemophilus parainfluenzae]|uniref:ESPR-type extended signal peptide-containing protein n=1 Tax=Haemophilus parainfluenzae TaxID=729 RepID=UPI00066D25B1|nr:ESPR-type extended signal peptide-containing protein [Haemophilus parainfluenzae]